VEAVRKILEEARDVGTGALPQGSSEEEWEGLSDIGSVEMPIDLEEEYVDEDRYTTVTVEAVNVDRDGLYKPLPESESDPEGDVVEPNKQGGEGAQGSSRRLATKEKPKKKKKPFRYESKFDRQLTERKQRAKRVRR